MERCLTKEKVWSGIKTFSTIKKSSPLISSINKLKKRKAAKVSTFDFLTLYTKIPHEKLLHVLNEIIDFASKDVTKDCFTVYSSRALKSSSRAIQEVKVKK